MEKILEKPIDAIDYDDVDHYNYLLSSIGACFTEVQRKNLKDLFFDEQLKSNRDRHYSLHSTMIKSLIDHDIKLICLCSSYIDTLERLKYLLNMLESWSKNIFRVRMILSICYNASLGEAVEKHIDQLQEKYKDQLIIINNGTTLLSQFSQYKIICDQYLGKFPDHWVIFSDDDDIWSTMRTAPFNLMISIINMLGRIEKDKVVSYARYSYLCEGRKHYKCSKDINSKELAAGRITMLCDKTEYISYALRFETLNIFVTEADGELLKNSLCDRYLIKFLKSDRNKYLVNNAFINLPFWGWGYYYYNTKFSIKDHMPNVPPIGDNIALTEAAERNLTLYYADNHSNDNLFQFLKSLSDNYVKCDDTKGLESAKLKFVKQVLKLLVEHDYSIYKHSPIIEEVNDFLSKGPKRQTKILNIN
ncbi:MAG: hypothetical protein Harvfovirus14_3 [Harvfovirus sp.]|uniref:Uncharacterized protein n=1 Tax=Harvfovirus sp. TaxID=2487768 RepID=A0A3G5A1F8_9VIRU|nr:MAG: hypothetical protein Harvfovirus14_3 [Harvfovirus sp.]